MDKNQNPTEQTAGTPDGLENKSAEQVANEVKTAKAARDLAETPAQAGDDLPDTLDVTMVHHAQDGDTALVPGETYSLPTQTALSLIGARRAKKV